MAVAVVVHVLAAACLSAARADSSTCGGELTDSYGVVVSPGYPQSYRADESCLWHIAPNVTESGGVNGTQTAGLTLTFPQFQTLPADSGGGTGASGSEETLFVYTSDPTNGTSPSVSEWFPSVCFCCLFRPNSVCARV